MHNNTRMVIKQSSFGSGGKGDHKYKPENELIIDDSYKKSYDINVLIEYVILNRQIASSCGDLLYATLTDGIKIISIEKE